ncbi:MAG: SUMF1/EgtB/PvdO family nonheme iron enzyme [Bacteroidota bacterium]
MNKMKVISRPLLLAAIAAGLLMQGCGLGKRNIDGELTGVEGREGWIQTVPYGMTVVPSGTFHMGQSDEDIAATNINFNKQITIGGFYMDDTEITNNEYRQFAESLGKDDTAGIGTLKPDQLKMIADKKFFPDTTVWMRDFTHHMGDPMLQYYYMHPAFDDYPAVGVNWKAAQLFCRWRTYFLNKARNDRGEFSMPNFRLPSEAEWEYAARGGRDLSPYPWGGPYIRNTKGCLLANFKPGRGNYYDDGFSYTSPVAGYFANDYGLFDMSGNVSEWCEDAFYEASVPVVWDLNPTYFKDTEPRKVVRGGSWKDISYFLQTGTRTYEYEDTAKSYIGFRCVVTYLGRSAGNEF